jgi:hypothetical protein
MTTAETVNPEEMQIYDDVFQELIDQFCIDNNIDDMRTASQSVWNSCLRNIYKHLFKNSDVLKSKETQQTNSMIMASNNNAYDMDAVNEILEYYIYDLCMRYDKEISIIGFSTLTGIEHSTIHNWGCVNSSDKLSQKRLDIFKKLNHFREESLSNKLATGNKNPVGILAILNRHYSWNLPGVSKETAPKQALTAAELPRLNGSELHKNTLIPDNMQIDTDITKP